MAQYDLHLIQNVAAEGIEFSEKQVNITKGGILSAIADGTPTVLAGGTNGYMLVRDDVEVTGLKWQAISVGHTQNTDTGTTGNTFTIDSDSETGKIIIDVVLGAADAALTLTNAEITEARTITFPDATGTVALTSDLPSNPLTYQGVIDCSANPNYPEASIGDTYVVSVAGKIGGASGTVVESGDTIICKEASAGGTEAAEGAKFNIVQKNIDGAVTGPASVSDGALVLFDGVTGKVIKAGTGAPGTMAYEAATDYVAKALFNAQTILAATADDTPAALTVGEQTIVGRKTGGNIAALTAAEAMNVLWQSAPATKTSTGTAGMIAKDDNFFYVCTSTDTWKRSPIATNW